MTVLVVGATGATGRLLVKELIARGLKVRAIVRSPEKLPEELRAHGHLHVVTASISDIGDSELADLLRGCDAVVSCLGHNLSLKGVLGHPRKLVTQAVRRLCLAIKANRSESPVRFILMNSVGVRNRDISERISFGERCVMGLIRLLLPPQSDNECAADVLRGQIPDDDASVEWVVVRPTSLTNDLEVSEYEVLPSPTRSAMFDPAKISRVNVAHFMADLITDNGIWSTWRGRMPVISYK